MAVITIPNTEVYINNIPFIFKQTSSEESFSVTFPAVSKTVFYSYESIMDGTVAYSGQASEQTTISKNIVSPYIYCNGIFVKKGNTTTVKKLTAALITGKTATYRITYNNDGSLILKTVASFNSTTKPSETTVTVDASSWDAIIVPCDGPVDEINYNGNSVGILKYNDNIVWLKKFKATVSQKENSTYKSSVYIKRVSNQYLSTLDTTNEYIADYFECYYGDTLEIQVVPNSNTVVSSVQINYIEQLTSSAIAPDTTKTFNVSIKDSLYISLTNCYKKDTYSVSKTLQWSKEVTTSSEAGTYIGSQTIYTSPVIGAAYTQPTAYRITGTANSSGTANLKTLPGIVTIMGKTPIIISDTKSVTSGNNIRSTSTYSIRSESKTSGLYTYIFSADAKASISMKQGSGGALVYTGNSVTLNVTGIEMWYPVN